MQHYQLTLVDATMSPSNIGACKIIHHDEYNIIIQCNNETCNSITQNSTMVDATV
jgi:hypothetical protein